MKTYEEYLYGLQPPGDYVTASDSAPHSGGSEYRSRCCWFVSLPCAPRTGPRTDPDRVRVRIATVQLVITYVADHTCAFQEARADVTSLPPSPPPRSAPRVLVTQSRSKFPHPLPLSRLARIYVTTGSFSLLPHAGQGRLSRASLHLRRPDKGSPAFSKFRTRLCRCSRPPQEGVAKAG